MLATAAVTAAAGPGTSFLRLGLVHRQGSAIDHLAAHAADRRRGLLVGRHLDEPEPLRPAGLPIGNDLGRLYTPVRGEHVLQLGLGHIERQVSDVQLLTHGLSPYRPGGPGTDGPRPEW